MKPDRICAARQLDPDRVASAFIGVVSEQAIPQASSLDAHERIGLGIEVGGPAEDLHPDRVSLEARRRAGERFADEKLEEIGGAPGPRKTPTGQDPFELRSDFRGARLGRAFPCARFRVGREFTTIWHRLSAIPLLDQRVARRQAASSAQLARWVALERSEESGE